MAGKHYFLYCQQQKSNNITGRFPPKINLKSVINAVFYVTKTGIDWRSLPHDFPCWQTVYGLL